MTQNYFNFICLFILVQLQILYQSYDADDDSKCLLRGIKLLNVLLQNV